MASRAWDSPQFPLSALPGKFYSQAFLCLSVCLFLPSSSVVPASGLFSNNEIILVSYSSYNVRLCRYTVAHTHTLHGHALFIVTYTDTVVNAGICFAEDYSEGPFLTWRGWLSLDCSWLDPLHFILQPL